MGVQENSTGLGSPALTTAIMFAGEIGVGGPMSFDFSIRCDSSQLTFSQSARLTVSPLRVTSPAPFFTKISWVSVLGLLLTTAALSGDKEAVAPATVTCDFDPCT